MSAARGGTGGCEDHGFVLVGVLMFILIITILGLTLFSLSGFESQFFTNSLDQQRAFYSATGGIERAKFVLASTSNLPDARNIGGVALDGLTYTVAKQGTDFANADSLGKVKWDHSPDPVWIRSLAVVGNQRAMVEAQFTPNREKSYYTRLFTLSSPAVGLNVIAIGGAVGSQQWAAAAQVSLSGELWQNATAQTWLGAVPPPGPIDLSGGVPTPDILSYLADPRFAGAWVMPRNFPTDVYYLDAYSQSPTEHIGFWKTPFANHYDTAQGYWSLNGVLPGIPSPSPAEIHVTGTCVWMFDQGVRFDRIVNVYGSGNADDALIIIARPGLNPLEPGKGIVFNRPLVSLNVPVFLVTDGGVGDENTNDGSAPSTVTYLSVFAATCDLIGPRPGVQMSLSHLANAAPDVPSSGLIDRLSKKRYLPNTNGVSADFIPIPGKWRQITDSNPVN